MGRSGCRASAACLLALAVGLSSPSAHAEVIKRVRFESSPSGADVYLKRGGREERLGTTPLSHEVEFHSEISVVRFAFKKPGYRTAELKMSASDGKLVARLERFSLAAAPETFEDAGLKAAQRKINPVLTSAAPRLLESKGRYAYELEGPLRVARLGGELYLVIPIVLGESKASASKVDRERMLKDIWAQFGDAVVFIGAKIRNHTDIAGIVLDVDYGEQRAAFGVGARVSTRVEMKCVPGYDSRISTTEQCYDAVTRRNYMCQKTIQVFNPCKYQTPVERREVTPDPKTTATRGRGSARYVVPKSLASGSPVPFDKLAIVATDENGKTLYTQGSIPGMAPGGSIAAPE